MNSAPAGILRYTVWFFLGFSLMNSAWSADLTDHTEIITEIALEEFAPRCPPFNEGDIWNMHRTMIMANGMTIEAEITITVTGIDGEIVEYEWVTSGSPTIYSEIRRQSGILTPVKDRVANIELDYISETPLCPPPDIGQSIVGVGKLNGVVAGKQITTVMEIDPFFIQVTVPAGTFNTRKILTEVTSAGASPPYTITHYFADGVGSAKEIFRFADGSIQIHELVGYNF